MKAQTTLIFEVMHLGNSSVKNWYFKTRQDTIVDGFTRRERRQRASKWIGVRLNCRSLERCAPHSLCITCQLAPRSEFYPQYLFEFRCTHRIDRTAPPVTPPKEGQCHKSLPYAMRTVRTVRSAKYSTSSSSLQRDFDIVETKTCDWWNKVFLTIGFPWLLWVIKYICIGIWNIHVRSPVNVHCFYVVRLESVISYFRPMNFRPLCHFSENGADHPVRSWMKVVVTGRP
jgi:hypothetical protein